MVEADIPVSYRGEDGRLFLDLCRVSILEFSRGASSLVGWTRWVGVGGKEPTEEYRMCDNKIWGSTKERHKVKGGDPELLMSKTSQIAELVRSVRPGERIDHYPRDLTMSSIRPHCLAFPGTGESPKWGDFFFRAAPRTDFEEGERAASFARCHKQFSKLAFFDRRFWSQTLGPGVYLDTNLPTIKKTFIPKRGHIGSTYPGRGNLVWQWDDLDLLHEVGSRVGALWFTYLVYQNVEFELDATLRRNPNFDRRNAEIHASQLLELVSMLPQQDVSAPAAAAHAKLLALMEKRLSETDLYKLNGKFVHEPTQTEFLPIGDLLDASRELEEFILGHKHRSENELKIIRNIRGFVAARDLMYAARGNPDDLNF